MPVRRARSTARLDGADTAATSGIPPRKAFCTISNDDRPLTKSAERDNGSRLAHQRMSHEFVHRVMPANVLGAELKSACEIEKARSVKPAGLIKSMLRVSQRSRETCNGVDIEVPVDSERRLVDVEGLERAASAQPAGGILDDVPAQAQEVRKDLCPAPAEHHIQYAGGIRQIDTLDVFARSNHTLRKQKARGKIGIPARCAHDDREGMAIEAHLERGFHRHAVAGGVEPAGRHSHQLDAARRFSHDQRLVFRRRGAKAQSCVFERYLLCGSAALRQRDRTSG